MEIKYDTTSAVDIPHIVELKMDMFCEFGYDKNLGNNAREVIAEDYKRMYEDGLAIHFLAKVDGLTVGMAGAFIKSDIPYRYFANSQYGFISDVYTVPAHRNLGISTKLNEAALDWLRDYGVDSVRLLASEAGRPIYEQLGFSPDVAMVLNLS